MPDISHEFLVTEPQYVDWLNQYISGIATFKLSSTSQLCPDPELTQQSTYQAWIDAKFIPLSIYNNQWTVLTCTPMTTSSFDKLCHHSNTHVIIVDPDVWLTIYRDNHPVLRCPKDPIDQLSSLINYAIEHHASDIHCEWEATYSDVWMRIQGQLTWICRFTHSECSALINIIKLQSGMDISMNHKPQDGYLSYKYQTSHIDIRVSSLPTSYGDSIVLRLFGSQKKSFELSQIGLPENVIQSLNNALSNTNGLILVTGPTGSGKTTTLYSMLKTLQTNKRQPIITLEDPIEAQLPGIRQSPINTNASYEFSTGLRAILRQDPEVIMIGEIRDHDTAKYAINAAYTGHLVVSSLHTQDCRSTLRRLMGLDIDMSLCAQSLRGILSQKLVGRRCTHPDHSNQCPDCHGTGYVGRTLIVEWFEPHPQRSFHSIDDFIQCGEWYSFEMDINHAIQTNRCHERDLQEIIVS